MTKRRKKIVPVMIPMRAPVDIPEPLDPGVFQALAALRAKLTVLLW